MKFAVIKTGGKQYRVAEGEILKIEKLPLAKGAAAVFDEVLLTSDGDITRVGNPLVAGAKVVGEVLDQKRAEKVLVLKYKPKTRYRVKRGHRQSFSSVKITKLDF